MDEQTIHAITTKHSNTVLCYKTCDSDVAYCSPRRGPAPREQVVVAPNTPAMRTAAAQLTENSTDFAERERYHQSEVVKGENFDEYN